MYALFEDTGKFLTGRILSQTDTTAQIELETGKRQKVKLGHVLITFNAPTPRELLASASQISETIDLNLAWEFASEDEFGFVEFAQEYFSSSASLAEQAAALFCLYAAPHYFRRAGKGRFKKVPAVILAQALQAIEKKRLIAEQIDQWAGQLLKGQCPEPIEIQLYKILFRPDKNAAEYKAVVQAAKLSKKAPLDLLQEAGAIKSAYQFHWQRFLSEQFSKGTSHPSLLAPALETLEKANVEAFSIDDSNTNEIDDALSLVGVGSGKVRLGVHISAPGLAILPGSEIDQIAKSRMSTVYMPGNKITMLPRSVVEQFSLDEGKYCPALSFYIDLKEDSLEVLQTESKIESVFIKANLRHDQLSVLITEELLLHPMSTSVANCEALKGISLTDLQFLFRLAQKLKLDREQVRGKPDVQIRPDFSFQLHLQNDLEPTGNERVEIHQRKRGEPLDLIVAEAMILTNHHWGRLLADKGVPGIYRSQAALAPGVKVRMGTKPLVHAGIGVDCYAWSSSPLRRYVDMVNQWQLIACIKQGNTAALVAPFKPKDASLFAIISGFDDAYAAYRNFQNQIELYWTLRYLAQENIQELEAVVIREGLARANELPLVLTLVGGAQTQRGDLVKLKISKVNELLLAIEATVTEVISQTTATNASAEEAEAEEELGVAPVAIAMDLEENAESAGTSESAQMNSNLSEPSDLAVPLTTTGD